CSATARHHNPTATASRRRLIVAGEGKRAGRDFVVCPWATGPAQETGRSCHAVRRMVSNQTQPGLWTYFGQKSPATSRTTRYLTGESSGCMADRLSQLYLQLKSRQKRELLCLLHFTSPLKNVVTVAENAGLLVLNFCSEKINFQKNFCFHVVFATKKA